MTGLLQAWSGGEAEALNQLAPLGPVYQAGTLSGNPLAMAAGIATLSHLEQNRDSVYRQLDQTAATVTNGVASAAAEAGIPLTTNRQGAMFTWFFTPNPVRDFASAESADTQRFAAFHRGMLERGIWLPPSQFEAAFLGTAHTPDHVDQTIAAAREVFPTLQE